MRQRFIFLVIFVFKHRAIRMEVLS